MDWDQIDVLVMGSGGAGQCAALRAHDLGLDVLIAEKGATWGGSTAMSGGAVWVPNNRDMKAKGIEDSEDDAVKYILHLTGGSVAEDRIRTFVREGNRMIDYLEANTHLSSSRWRSTPTTTPRTPGAEPAGAPWSRSRSTGPASARSSARCTSPIPPRW